MIRKKNIFYIIISFSLGLLSCNKDNSCDCFKSTGDIKKEDRTITAFNEISVENNINLFITEDTFYSVTVEAGSHLLSSIKAEVTDSCLYLKNENKCNWVRSLKKNKVNVYLTFKKIKRIMDNDDSGDINSMDTIHANYFQLDDFDGSGTINLLVNTQTSNFKLHTGPADLYVKGKSGESLIYSAGNGLADLRNLKTDYTYITNNSTNNCYVNVSGELDVFINYVGDIYYTGNPSQITTDITSSGRLIKF